jgi:hypothetical protein
MMFLKGKNNRLWIFILLLVLVLLIGMVLHYYQIRSLPSQNYHTQKTAWGMTGELEPEHEEDTFVNLMKENETEFSFGKEDFSQIPNTIWTFWDGEPSGLVERCIQSWKKYNPSYEVHVLNKKNINEYLPDIDINGFKRAGDSLARYSDFVRLLILLKYGGIWMDASIICHKPLTWMHSIQKKFNVEMVGYYMDTFTSKEHKEYSPIIASWFIACTPGSSFVRDWCSEFLTINNYETADDYIKHLREVDKITSQNIGSVEYLAIYMSAQKLLQKDPHKYDLYLIAAEKSPFKFLMDTNLNVEKSIGLLTGEDTRENYFQFPFVKLTREDRATLEKHEKQKNAFS